jgi:hypothetical protein
MGQRKSHVHAQQNAKEGQGRCNPREGQKPALLHIIPIVAYCTQNMTFGIYSFRFFMKNYAFWHRFFSVF